MNHPWSRVEAATGRVLSSGSCSYPQDIPEPKPGQYILYEEVDGKDGYLNPHGEKTERPALDAPTRIAAEIGASVTLSLPEGTEIKRFGDVLGITDGTPLVITGEAEGVIEYELHPPFPYRPHTLRVVVGEQAMKQKKQASDDARRAELAKNLTSGLKKAGG